MRQRQVDQQVQARYAEQDFERRKRGGDDFTATLEQLGNGDHRHQRGVLDQADKLPGQWRQYALERLRQHHIAHRLAAVEAQRAGCFVLPASDGLHARADDFSHVRTGEQRQRGNTGKFAGQVEYSADKEVEDKDLHQQRRAAYQFYIQRREVTQGRVVRQPAQAGGQADDQTQHARHQRQPDRGPQAPQQRPGSPVAVDANYITFVDFVAFSQLQAVAGNGYPLFIAIFATQHHFGAVALAYQFDDGRVFSCPLGFFGLIGEVLRNAVPAPFVRHQRGGVIQRTRQADEHQHGQYVPGPLDFFLFDHFQVPRFVSLGRPSSRASPR